MMMGIVKPSLLLLLAFLSAVLVSFPALEKYEDFFENSQNQFRAKISIFFANFVLAILLMFISQPFGVVCGWLLLLSACFSISMIDFFTFTIPDRLIFQGLFAVIMIRINCFYQFDGSVVALLWQVTCGALVCAILIASKILFEIFFARPTMGWGDIKLIALWALLLGERISHVIILSILFAAVSYGIYRILSRNQLEWRRPFPFAPHLCLAFTLIVALNYSCGICSFGAVTEAGLTCIDSGERGN